MSSCITCGIPFTGDHANDIGLTTPEGPVCTFDSENGQIKSPEAIFVGGIEFFLEAAADGDRVLATRLTVKNMKSLPYWQTHPFELLSGEEAADEEFSVAMAKL